eukprot:CAMPEP_0118954114 /NCGR_PEP_ID=MMETSP1169-20130426/57716_1 /TAXON_ID=36882 /ORGANISM="Pyramimonas obovata, Strain CCMP722" /LENGTH=30 /DNA_ID= /DNA_START= /DNA_END= /DNA_ORIENTATION=
MKVMLLEIFHVIFHTEILEANSVQEAHVVD